MTDISSSKTCLGCSTGPHQSVCQATHQSDDWDEASLTKLIEKFDHTQPLIEYRDGEFIFYDEHWCPYAIDANRVDTNAKLLEWIRHMTEKAWVTGLHIHEFVKLAAAHLRRIKIDYSV